jgi:MOSC domain-containing protein YiiM
VIDRSILTRDAHQAEDLHMPVVQSIQVGRAQTYTHAAADSKAGDGSAADGKPAEWTTAFFKFPVAGTVDVGQLGIVGDEQVDRRNHGGPDKAVLVYSADHLPLWRERLSLPEMAGGAFGENLTVAGSTEEDVCIGDVWEAGDVQLQVTQPRQPCWKMSRRWNVPTLAQQVIASGLCGWYLRVLRGGSLAPGDTLTLASRPNPDWTIARATHLFHHQKDDLAGARELAVVAELSTSWRESLAARLAKHAAAAG